MASNPKDPSFPFYAFDWLSSLTVSKMTLTQQGAFVRLLCHCWGSGDASLPDDRDDLRDVSLWRTRRIETAFLFDDHHCTDAVEEFDGEFDLVFGQFVCHPEKPGFLTHPKLWEAYIYRRKEKIANKKRTEAATAARRDRNDERNDERNVVHSNSNSNSSGSIGGECTTNGSVESKTKTKSKRTTRARSAYTHDFERFWSAFPAERKSKKADAWRAWKIHVNDDDVETVIAAAAEYAESDEARCKYVAGPAPWLNGERWQDDRKAWDRTVKDASDTAAQERAAEERREKHRAKQRLEQQRRVEEMEAAKRRNRSEAVPGFKLKNSD